MYAAKTFNGLFSHLKNKKIKSRHDSIEEQAADMLPIFEAFGMYSTVSKLIKTFSVDDQSTLYLSHVQDIYLSIDLEETAQRKKECAIHISTYFGCNELAIFFKTA